MQMPKTEEKYIVALDIGTSKVCVLVGEVTDRNQLEIIGKGTAPMKGTRRGNIINLDQAIDAVKKAVDEAEAVLTQDEREMGVLLMELGAGTTDYAVFLEGNVIHTNVLPVGAGHFTSDISVVLRTPMEDAERIKKRYGCALASLVTNDDPIEVPTVGGRAPKILSKHELTNILEPRAAEIAKLVYQDLEKVGLEKEIRSGVVLVGGGAEMDGMVEMIEQVFDQQARKGVPRS